MSSHVVEELAFRLEGDGLSQADLRSAEAFVRAALDRACEITEGRLGGQLLYVRSLPMNVRLTTDELVSRRAVDDVAEAVAASLLVLADRADSSTDAPAWVFRTLAHRTAAAAEMLSRFQPAWFAEEWRNIDDCLRSVLIDPVALIEVFVLLMDRGELGSVLRTASPPIRRALRDALTAAAEVAGQDLNRSMGAPRAGDAGSVSLERIRGFAAAVASIAETMPPHQVLLPSVSEDLPALVPTNAAGLLIATPTGSTPDPATFDDAASLRPVRELPQTPQAVRRHGSAPLILNTRAAGLFFMLNPVLELDVGEVLWKASVDEGAAIAQAARLLASDAPDDDPAFALLGAGTSAQPNQNQCAHIVKALVASVAAALSRRRLGSPAVSTCAARLHGASVVLLGLPPDVPIFAVLDSTVLPSIGEAWPFECHAATLGREEGFPRRSAVEDFLMTGPDVAWRAVLTTIAGVVSALACLRLRRHAATDPVPVLAAAVGTHGEICVREDELRVRIPSEALRLPMRLAGLDRNPGWVPWLRKSVRFDFHDPDAARGPATGTRLEPGGGP